jgi:23S rRNA (guanosine2251-2'-O)-methyltransferase
MARNPSHQGFVAIAEDYRTFTLEEIVKAAKSKPYPLVALLDGIEDPHNLGAILRSADAFGIDGLVMKKANEVPLNGTVAKVSTGAINYVKVAVVSNLSQAIQRPQGCGLLDRRYGWRSQDHLRPSRLQVPHRRHYRQ